MPEEQDLAAVEEADAKVADSAEAVTIAVDKVAKEAGEPPIDHSAATVAALGRLAEHQAQTNALIEQQSALLQGNLNEFSRALSNTDISAQRAAQAAAATEEAITPADETAPDKGAKPEDVQELPKSEIAADKSKVWWFGKAAYRHGKSKPRVGG